MYDDFPDDDALLGAVFPTDNSTSHADQDPETDAPVLDLNKILENSAFPAKDYVPKDVKELAGGRLLFGSQLVTFTFRSNYEQASRASI
jgi:hypothetical protein